VISLHSCIEVVSRAAPLVVFNNLLAIHSGWYISLIFTKTSSKTPALSIDVSDDASDIRQLSIVLEILQDNLTYSFTALQSTVLSFWLQFAILYVLHGHTHVQIPGSVD